MTAAHTILADPAAYSADRVRATRKMFAAREDMLTSCPFWGALALRLAVVEDPTCNTAWTDGVSIGYSVAYINSITHDECVFLIAHEVAHCAFGHPWRRDGREHRDWNVATDYAINSELARHGFSLPAGVLLSPEYDGRGAEWIYARTAEGKGEGEGGQDEEREPGDDSDSDDDDEGEGGVECGEPGDDCQGDDSADGEGDDSPSNESSGEGEGDGEGGEGDSDGEGSDEGSDAPRTEAPGEVRDAPAPTADEPGMDEVDWKQAVSESALTAKRRGDYGGDVERVVGQVQKAKVDWVAVLRAFVSEIAKADYSWTQPNTRYIPMGIFLPALRADGLGPMVVGIDTSGSVDSVQLAAMEAELRAIVGEANPERTTVVYCDTRVNHVQTFERGEPVTLVPKGGGGTAFGPVFEYVAGMGERPACLVYLTDMQGRFPDAAPDYPVLWVNTGRYDYRAPFGQVVRVG
jgi:predicted metal-dependent peptidase